MLYAQQEERLNEGLMSHEDDLRLDAIPAPLNLDEIDDDSDEHHEEGMSSDLMSSLRTCFTFSPNKVLTSVFTGADFVGEDIHIDGVPRSTLRLDARCATSYHISLSKSHTYHTQTIHYSQLRGVSAHLIAR